MATLASAKDLAGATLSAADKAKGAPAANSEVVLRNLRRLQRCGCMPEFNMQRPSRATSFQPESSRRNAAGSLELDTVVPGAVHFLRRRHAQRTHDAAAHAVRRH